MLSHNSQHNFTVVMISAQHTPVQTADKKHTAHCDDAKYFVMYRSDGSVGDLLKPASCCITLPPWSPTSHVSFTLWDIIAERCWQWNPASWLWLWAALHRPNPIFWNVAAEVRVSCKTCCVIICLIFHIQAFAEWNQTWSCTRYKCDSKRQDYAAKWSVAAPTVV